MREGILARAKKRKPGVVLTPPDFADLGSPYAVGVALGRLVRDGTMRRVGRGLYDLPRQHPVLGELHATTDAIAKALSDRHGIRLQPTGAYAANILGLSTQVPMRVAFLTDGTSRTLRIGGTEIRLRHTSPRRMAAAGRISGLIINALRWIKRDYVSEDQLRPLRRRLDAAARKQLLADAHLAPVWVAHWMRWLAADDD